MTLRNTIVFTAALAVLAFASDAFAVGVVGNAAAGKKLATACAACHGDGNKTLDGTYPRLAGQYPEYLAKAMREYKSGKRKNAVMAGQMQQLTPEQMDDLAAYYGSLKGEIHDLSKHAD
jgi:cytochrome c553